MATAANALWETFLQGRDMPVARDEWRRAAGGRDRSVAGLTTSPARTPDPAGFAGQLLPKGPKGEGLARPANPRPARYERAALTSTGSGR